MDALPVTLCVSTRNAANVLAGCIESVREWVCEIVIVDMESTDATLEIARSFAAKVVHVPAAGWAEPGRQSGIDAASQPWILVLDADERAADGIRTLAAHYARQGQVAGVWLPRQNFQLGWWMARSGIWPDWQLRLFRRDATTWPGTRTHVGAVVQGEVVRAAALVENAIVHHSFPTLHDWITSTNRYTDLEAERLTGEGRRASLPRLFAIPTARFAENYIFKRGFLSGRYGFAAAVMSLFYWVLTELKIWERQLAIERPARDAVAETPIRR
jgi:glycosyltransferase involved in cell wall biosynthesis